MASSLGAHHGHAMALLGDFSLGGFHGLLPWPAHWELTMAMPWHCLGTSHWADSMDFFHGQLIGSSPWPCHGIAWGLLIGRIPWTSSMASSLGAHHGHAMALLGDFSL